jgi:hypothetical protein
MHGGHTLRFVLKDAVTGKALLSEKARFIAPP